MVTISENVQKCRQINFKKCRENGDSDNDKNEKLIKHVETMSKNVGK